MRNAIKSITGVALLVVSVFSASVSATECKSAAKVGSDIWVNWGDWLKAGGCSVAGILAENPALAADCIQQANKWDKVVQDSIKFWNDNANNSWATIGPRDLVLDDTEKGTLQSTAGRMFVTTTPVPKGSKITISELDGKGKTGVAICSISKNGRVKKLKEFTFNDTSAEKKNKRQVMSYVYNGNGDVVLSAHLDGKTILKKFQYKISITP